MVLTCGYLHQENLRFKSLQWSRRKEHVENLFFYYTDSRAHVYTIPGDHWLNRSHISYIVEDRETHLGVTLTVLTLRLHRITDEMSGRYRCRVSMTPKDDSETERLATRTTNVVVVPGNDPKVFQPEVKISVSKDDSGLTIVCSGVGNPAPYLSWSVMVGDRMEEVADRVIWGPIAHQQDGLENATVTMREPCCGDYVCTASSRFGENHHYFITTTREGEAIVASDIWTTTTTAAPQPQVTTVPPKPQKLPWLYIGLILTGVACFFIFLCCCCCCISCRRKKHRKERRRKNLSAKLKKEKKKERGRETKKAPPQPAKRPRSRSVKRRAPDPALFLQPEVRDPELGSPQPDVSS